MKKALMVLPCLILLVPACSTNPDEGYRPRGVGTAWALGYEDTQIAPGVHRVSYQGGFSNNFSSDTEEDVLHYMNMRAKELCGANFEYEDVEFKDNPAIRQMGTFILGTGTLYCEGAKDALDTKDLEAEIADVGDAKEKLRAIQSSLNDGNDADVLSQIADFKKLDTKTPGFLYLIEAKLLAKRGDYDAAMSSIDVYQSLYSEDDSSWSESESVKAALVKRSNKD